jgi:hypothetical protein
MSAMNPDDFCMIDNGKTPDMLYVASKKPQRRVIVMDLPRTLDNQHDSQGDLQRSFINWMAIENLKNGSFVANKYESKECYAPIPHFIIFANFVPEKFENTVSHDRWRIHKIVNKRLVAYGVNAEFEMYKLSAFENVPLKKRKHDHVNQDDEVTKL